MIRIGLPPPALPRLRLRWHITRSSFARRSQAFREFAGRTAETTGVWWRQTVARTVSTLSLRAWAAERQRQRLQQFETTFEQLVDTLCCTAKMGVETDDETTFAKLRIAVRLQYRPLRSRLRPYWQSAESEEEADPFERLFQPDCVDKIINSLDGIQVLTQAQDALQAYRTSLESRR